LAWGKWDLIRRKDMPLFLQNQVKKTHSFKLFVFMVVDFSVFQKMFFKKCFSKNKLMPCHILA
jgi:hypothetical protein